MKRTRRVEKRKDPASAILVSDLHLTDSTPVSRMDDYILAQKEKLMFLQSLSARNNNCPILCAGDVFDHWKASPWLCSMAFQSLPRPFIGIPGQHDLPGHSLEQYEKSALALIDSVSDEDNFVIINKPGYQSADSDVSSRRPGKLHIIGFPFGTLNDSDHNPDFEFSPNYRYILIAHELTWQNKRPSWDKGSWTDLELIDKFGEYFDLILVGDNHSGFVTREENCILVNPGSMMRMNADQEDYRPRCYLYYADENDVAPVYFPIERGVHNREHLDRKKERDERIAAYVERMEMNWETGLSFRKNLDAFFIENDTPQKVREVIWSALETEKN